MLQVQSFDDAAGRYVVELSGSQVSMASTCSVCICAGHRQMQGLCCACTQVLKIKPENFRI